MDYPATVDVDTPEKIARWRPLVHGILAIPHFMILYVLQGVAQIIMVISWFAILFTGRLPEGLANFQCMTLRYGLRVSAYAGFLHDTYPPFEFDMTPGETGTGPTRVNLVPALGGRNRLTVGLRFIWIIPAAIVTFIILIIAWVCWFIAFFAVLFTGKWPAGLRGWAMKGLRAQTRLNAYIYLLTDQYPPMTFDDQPPAAPPAAAPAEPVTPSAPPADPPPAPPAAPTQ